MADDNRWSDRDRDWRDDRNRTEPSAPRGGYREREDGWRGASERDYGAGGRDSPGYNPAGPAQGRGYGLGGYDRDDYQAYGEEAYREQRYGEPGATGRDRQAARAYQEGDIGRGYRDQGGQGYRGQQGSGGYSEARYGRGLDPSGYDYSYGPYTPYGPVTEGETSSDYYRPRPQRYGGSEGRYGDHPWRGDGEHRSWVERTGEKLGHFVRDHTPGEHHGRGPRGYKRSDERIREDLNDHLTEDGYLDASDIEVTVTGGEVTLSGTVKVREHKRRAEDIADAVSGVTHVQNNLRLDRGDGAGDRIIDGPQGVLET